MKLIKMKNLVIDKKLTGRRCRQKWFVVFDWADRPRAYRAIGDDCLDDCLANGCKWKGHYCYTKTVRGKRYNLDWLSEQVEFYTYKALDLALNDD